MRILLIEDDPQLGDAVKVGLSLHHFKVDWVRDGFAALHECEKGIYDALVLDLSLPRIDGLDVLAQLRQKEFKKPILILTARGQSQDITLGLDHGADDYVTKPFDLAILAARLRALIRRSHGSTVDGLQWGPIVVMQAQRSVMIAGRPVDLTAKEYDLLLPMVLSHGKVMTSFELESKLYAWGEEVQSNTLHVHMYKLRKKLSKFEGVSIRTVRGVGYQLRYMDGHKNN